MDCDRHCICNRSMMGFWSINHTGPPGVVESNVKSQRLLSLLLFLVIILEDLLLLCMYPLYCGKSTWQIRSRFLYIDYSTRWAGHPFKKKGDPVFCIDQPFTCYSNWYMVPKLFITSCSYFITITYLKIIDMVFFTFLGHSSCMWRDEYRSIELIIHVLETWYRESTN